MHWGNRSSLGVERPVCMNKSDAETLRQQAMGAMQESTRLLQHALDLFSQGKVTEAKAMRNAAEMKDKEAARLLIEAMQVEGRRDEPSISESSD